VVDMGYKSHGAHIGCSLSIVDILTALYFSVMLIRPKDPKWENRDYFILSKGHACSALYATLAERGFFPHNLLKGYLTNGSHIAGHITLGSLPGIEATSGSLGHGLSIGAGIAVSLRNEGKKSKVYVIVGDGEAEEGSIWEAVMFIGHHKLNNIILIIDNNNLQIMGKSNKILNSSSFTHKLRGFGWDVEEIDGHNISEIISTLHRNQSDNPLAIVANTIKGKGVSFMENKVEWHGKSLSESEFRLANIELDKSI
jgi:transketolase